METDNPRNTSPTYLEKAMETTCIEDTNIFRKGLQTFWDDPAELTGYYKTQKKLIAEASFISNENDFIEFIFLLDALVPNLRENRRSDTLVLYWNNSAQYLMLLQGTESIPWPDGKDKRYAVLDSSYDHIDHVVEILAEVFQFSYSKTADSHYTLNFN